MATAYPLTVFNHILASLVAQMVKNSLAMQKAWVRSMSQKMPWRREGQPNPVLLPLDKNPMDRGYRPQGHKESDTTEWFTLSLHFLVSQDHYCLLLEPLFFPFWCLYHLSILFEDQVKFSRARIHKYTIILPFLRKSLILSLLIAAHLPKCAFLVQWTQQ